jgi:hypothetical protein
MLIGNFGDTLGLVFHNLIGGTFVRLRTRFVGETLYCIIVQPVESTKNLKIYSYYYALPTSQNHPSNNLPPKT